LVLLLEPDQQRRQLSRIISDSGSPLKNAEREERAIKSIDGFKHSFVLRNGLHHSQTRRSDIGKHAAVIAKELGDCCLPDIEYARRFSCGEPSAIGGDGRVPHETKSSRSSVRRPCFVR